jgi:hypothetical protein
MHNKTIKAHALRHGLARSIRRDPAYDTIVDGLTNLLAEAEGNDVTLALDCLIAHARADQITMSARLVAHYQSGGSIIEVEWEEIK